MPFSKKFTKSNCIFSQFIALAKPPTQILRSCVKWTCDLRFQCAIFHYNNRFGRTLAKNVTFLAHWCSSCCIMCAYTFFSFDFGFHFMRNWIYFGSYFLFKWVVKHLMSAVFYYVFLLMKNCRGRNLFVSDSCSLHTQKETRHWPQDRVNFSLTENNEQEF